MEVLLLHPKSTDTFWSFKHTLKFIGKRAALPPLGLLTVAAMLITLNSTCAIRPEKMVKTGDWSSLANDDLRGYRSYTLRYYHKI
jgi:hypothetical protein